MKPFKRLFIFTFISISVFACSSDDDNSGGTTEDNQAKIIGTWRFVSSTTNGVMDVTDDCELMDTAAFNLSQVTFTYFEGLNCEYIDSDILDYSISGNMISTTIEGQTFSSEITTLNSTTLTIENNDNDDIYTETYTKQ